MVIFFCRKKKQKIYLDSYSFSGHPTKKEEAPNTAQNKIKFCLLVILINCQSGIRQEGCFLARVLWKEKGVETLHHCVHIWSSCLITIQTSCWETALSLVPFLPEFNSNNKSL